MTYTIQLKKFNNKSKIRYQGHKRNNKYNMRFRFYLGHDLWGHDQCYNLIVHNLSGSTEKINVINNLYNFIYG